MTLDAFTAKYYGQHVANNHGAYVGECVSLAARKAQEVDGIADGDRALYCANTGGARDLWEWFGKPGSHIQEFYDQVSSPQYGDLVVWGANMGSYGDVAIYIGSGQVFGQLGTPVFLAAHPRALTPTPLGYLRLKGATGMQLQPGQLDKLIKAMKQAEPTADELNNKDWQANAGLAVDALWDNYGKNHYPPKPTEFVETKVYVPKA